MLWLWNDDSYFKYVLHNRTSIILNALREKIAQMNCHSIHPAHKGAQTVFSDNFGKCRLTLILLLLFDI